MKKLIIIALVLAFSMAGFAQKAKFGHVDYGSIMQVMPGIDSAQANLASYQKELEETGEAMVNEFKQKQEDYAKFAQTSSSSAILKVKEDELTKLYARLQEFVANSESELQAKQVELLKPFQEKLVNAIKDVAEKEGYTYVFDVTTLAFHADSQDLTAAVKAKLGIK